MTSINPPAPRAMRIAVLDTDEQSARLIANAFAERFDDAAVAAGLSDQGQGRWRVTLYLNAAIDETAVRNVVAAAGGAKAARALHFERVAARDWVRESLVGLQPVCVGRFVIHGAHDRTRVPFNRIGIEIEAALAFGTGHHGTTRGCLLALDGMCKAWPSGQKQVYRHPEVRAKRASKGDGSGRHPSRHARGAHLRMRGPSMLDLGTGSGVLAIAAARALRRRVVAADIDPAAVAAARANAWRNRAGALLSVTRADGVNAPAIRAAAPCDLVFANILLGPLQRLAAPLSKLVAPGGRLVLSGLLLAQANAARAAYPHFVLERRIEIDGWATLVLRHSAIRLAGFETRSDRARTIAPRRRRS